MTDPLLSGRSRVRVAVGAQTQDDLGKHTCQVCSGRRLTVPPNLSATLGSRVYSSRLPDWPPIGGSDHHPHASDGNEIPTLDKPSVCVCGCLPGNSVPLGNLGTGWGRLPCLPLTGPDLTLNGVSYLDISRYARKIIQLRSGHCGNVPSQLGHQRNSMDQVD